GADGDREIRATWGAAPANGATPAYEVRVLRGGEWTGWNRHDSPWSYTGNFDQATRFEVRAVVNGVYGGVTSSNTVTPRPYVPPAPSGNLGKGPSRGCQSGGGGCAEVRVSWTNMDPGRYRIFATVDGRSCCNFQTTVDIEADGRIQLQNHLGVRSGGERIAVRFENVSGGTSRTIGEISGSQWNNIGFNTW
ncbi:MAG: hypothetical protein ABW040_05490, partial [Microbacteriaceae bacterium]